MNIVSDAKISQQDLYLLYVDFSSIFTTIDLIGMMHDLGYPEDAVEVIDELYTKAITTIKLYFAEKGPIPNRERHNTGRYLIPNSLFEPR